MISFPKRRDGFAGQHLLVLPEPVLAQTRRHALLRGLQVTDAGYFPVAKNHAVDRRTGAPTTLVILCLSGEGQVRCGNESKRIGSGNFVWLPAHEPHAYSSSATEPWTIVWAHFNGEETAAWRRLLDEGSRDMVLSLPRDRLDEIALDQVYAALERGYGVKHQIAAGAALRQALSRVAQLTTAPKGGRSAEERVAGSIEKLRREWPRTHRLEELAVAAGVSITHYSALFRRHTGFSPIDFIIRERIRHACHLLDTTSFAIGDIAERVGYADAYYFTRCFRRVMGSAPREYRKVAKG